MFWFTQSKALLKSQKIPPTIILLFNAFKIIKLIWLSDHLLCRYNLVTDLLSRVCLETVEILVTHLIIFPDHSDWIQCFAVLEKPCFIVWLYKNRLIINMDKSRVLFFRGSKSIPSTRPLFCINNEVVCSADVKFLGICITEDLSWAIHIQCVSKT
jgi:hypothetical protein